MASLSSMKKGDRVGFVLHRDEASLYLIGFGAYQGQAVPPMGLSSELDEASSRSVSKHCALLDSGELVFMDEFWWSSEEVVQGIVKSYDPKVVSVADLKQVREARLTGIPIGPGLQYAESYAKAWAVVKLAFAEAVANKGYDFPVGLARGAMHVLEEGLEVAQAVNSLELGLNENPELLQGIALQHKCTPEQAVRILRAAIEHELAQLAVAAVAMIARMERDMPVLKIVPKGTEQGELREVERRVSQTTPR